MIEITITMNEDPRAMATMTGNRPNIFSIGPEEERP
jgi:hypothetical protein